MVMTSSKEGHQVPEQAVDAVAAEAPPRRRRLDSNVIIAVSAVTISLCALVVSLYEVSVMRSDQRASVWPYLDVSISYSADGFRIQATNNGIGPALIESVQITVDGEPVYDWDEVIERLVGPSSGIDYSNYLVGQFNGEVLPAEGEMLLFGVPGEWTPIKRQLAEGLSRATWQVCYCSVYGECWTLDSEGASREAAVCRPSEDLEFRQ
jgi:hypothetical protein